MLDHSGLCLAIALICLIWGIGIGIAINARVEDRRTLLGAFRRMEKDQDR